MTEHSDRHVTPRQVQVTFDCADPDRLARFWAEALGYKLQDPPPGFATWPDFLASIGVPEAAWGSRSAIVDPEGAGSRVFFQQVPEPKTAKNRLHPDLGTDNLDAETERLLGLGAAFVHRRHEHGVPWTTFTDPEGNEFCVGLHAPEG